MHPAMTISPPVNCTPAVDCITVANIGGVRDDKIAVLALASEHNFVDEAADGFANDLVDIFDVNGVVDNADSDDVFTVRAEDDVIQVMR